MFEMRSLWRRLSEYDITVENINSTVKRDVISTLAHTKYIYDRRTWNDE